MRKSQHSNRLSKQQKGLEGPKGIFGKLATQHDNDVKEIAKLVFEYGEIHKIFVGEKTYTGITFGIKYDFFVEKKGKE